jgi:hypothetical protein
MCQILSATRQIQSATRRILSATLSETRHHSVAFQSLFGWRSDSVRKVFGRILSILGFWLFLKIFSFRPEDSRRRSDGVRRLQSPTGRRCVIDCNLCVIDCSRWVRIWNILSVFSLRSKENQKNVQIRPKNVKKRQKPSKKVKNRPNTVRTPSERRLNGFVGSSNRTDYDPLFTLFTFFT